MVTVVPFPTTEETSNSSISRLAPGRPRPSPPEVEYPSCSARPTSGMPGPWSRAITTTPCRSPFVTTLSAISPRLAYMRMLRASSEIAAAITVWSPLEKPASAATLRPCWRAVTTSTSDAIGTRSSSSTVDAPRAALRYWPCLRIGTSTAPSATGVSASSRLLGQIFQRQDLVAEQPLRLLDAALQVAHGCHLAQVDADRDERLGDFGRQAGDDDGGAEQPRRLDRLHEVVRDVRVHRRHTGDVDHDHLRAVGADRPQQLLGQLTGTLRIDDPDDRQNEEPLAHLQHRRRQLADRLLLLPDDALALLHETHGHRVGDPVRRGLVGVENAVQFVEVFVVLAEQRAGEHVAQQQHDADDFVRLDPPRDDALGKVARVRLQRLERPGLERFDVVVVHRRRLGKDLRFGHRREQLGPRDPPRPLLTQLRAILAQVGDELAQQRRSVRCLYGETGGRRGPVLRSRGPGRRSSVVECCCRATARLVPSARVSSVAISR